MPFVEREERFLSRERFDVFLDRQCRRFLTEADGVGVMTEIKKWEALLISLGPITHPHRANKVLRHLLQPDHRLEASMRRISARFLLFLKLLR